MRAAEQRWGLGAPVARMAAQVHAESWWIPTAQNPVASGLAQFTAPTARWIAEIHPELSPPAPFSPSWALHALVLLDLHLYRTTRPLAAGVVDQVELEECERWAMVLCGYNGGLGWLARDRRLAAGAGADPDRWFCQVEKHSQRRAAAKRENRAYVRRILLDLEHGYLVAGWPGKAACR